LMKIMIINPDFGMTRAQMDQRLSLLQSAAGPDAILHMNCLEDTQVCIDSLLDVALASPEIVRMAIHAEQSGYDGIVLYCFSDPAVDACREAVRIPVIGGGQAAYLAATTVSRQFGVIVSSAARIPEKRMFAYLAGVDPQRVCSFEAVQPDGSFGPAALIAAGERMMSRDNAQALILGCLSWLNMADEVSASLGIPVIDAAIASVAMAAALIRMNLATSKAAYPLPPFGERLWSSGRLEIGNPTPRGEK
jgi:allantoin racemase